MGAIGISSRGRGGLGFALKIEDSDSREKRYAHIFIGKKKLQHIRGIEYFLEHPLAIPIHSSITHPSLIHPLIHSSITHQRLPTFKTSQHKQKEETFNPRPLPLLLQFALHVTFEEWMKNKINTNSPDTFLSFFLRVYSAVVAADSGTTVLGSAPVSAPASAPASTSALSSFSCTSAAGATGAGAGADSESGAEAGAIGAGAGTGSESGAGGGADSDSGAATPSTDF